MTTNQSLASNATSWRAEVIAYECDKWVAKQPGALRFATEEEAIRYAREVSFRWAAVRQFRAAPTNDPVNYHYVNGKLEPLAQNMNPVQRLMEALIDREGLAEILTAIEQVCLAKANHIETGTAEWWTNAAYWASQARDMSYDKEIAE